MLRRLQGEWKVRNVSSWAHCLFSSEQFSKRNSTMEIIWTCHLVFKNTMIYRSPRFLPPKPQYYWWGRQIFHSISSPLISVPNVKALFLLNSLNMFMHSYLFDIIKGDKNPNASEAESFFHSLYHIGGWQMSSQNKSGPPFVFANKVLLKHSHG